MVLNLEPCIHAFRGGVIQSINCITPKEPLASNSWVFPKNTYPWRPAQPRVQSWHGCWHYSQFPGWPILNWTYLPSGGKFPDPTLEYNRYSICKPLLNYLPEWRGEEKTIQVSVQQSTEVCVRFQLFMPDLMVEYNTHITKHIVCSITIIPNLQKPIEFHVNYR